MRNGRIALLGISLVGSFAAFSACGGTDDGSEAGGDGGGIDGTVDAATDTAASADGPRSDSSRDGASDARVDGAFEGGSDAASDAGTDATVADDGGDAGPCAPNETSCNGVCVDTMTDPSHCGVCDKVCTAANNECAVGACRLKRLTPVWEKTFKRLPTHFVGEYVSIGSIATDPSDHVIISGSCSGQSPSGCSSTGYDFGGGIKTGRSYIAAFDADGTYLWDKVFATAAGMRLATDVAGNVYFTRAVPAGTIDFGGGPRVITGTALAVVSYDATGGFRWDHLVEYTAAGATVGALAIAAGGVDEVTVGGNKNGRVDLGGGEDVGRDGFILSLGAGGAYRWSKVLHPGTKDEADVRSIAIDKNGQITVVGECAGMVDLGGGVKSCNSFAAAYAADGSWQWDLVPGRAVGIRVDVSNETITAGSAIANVRRDTAGATVFSVASSQFNGCAGGLCPILPFSISPTYDEYWYLGNGGANASLGRRLKSDGTGPQPWGVFSSTPMFGVNGSVYPTVLQVLVSGDVVSGGGYNTPGSIGGWAYLARFARPM